MQNRKTFWPYGILLSIFAIVCACIYTVYYSLDYPVHLDNFYFDKYQNVENGYNEIQIKQAKFDQDFKFNQNATIYIDGLLNQNEPQKLRRNKIVPVVDKNKNVELVFDTNATNLKAELLLSRPDTNQFNKSLNFKLEDNKFRISDLNLTMPGRWQVMMKLAANDDSVGFFKFELYAK
ncbi:MULTISPECIES: FixH family protein [Campylobacter]|uniref:Lipoprotein n=1 Tax=Campylobacter fetus TaxID=196 RepID=A0A5L8QSN2_CAMFE|nr:MULTISPECIES: FixH family protein [Campylobacter]HDX6329914.1 FixH family protein [Campylobacter fetus subsp. venerealis]AIR78330.1 putative cytochrome c oxidase-associated protein CcoH [Campylobacter fetus subsp. fetus 04/554]EAI4414761.1 hypothetical protein [Campylobacter fetus]EAI5407524.1 hypothetical protein [Campylobacter fetus]EAJ0327156.1 hypothetical protein [Campylobacter fetus]